MGEENRCISQLRRLGVSNQEAHPSTFTHLLHIRLISWALPRPFTCGKCLQCPAICLPALSAFCTPSAPQVQLLEALTLTSTFCMLRVGARLPTPTHSLPSAAHAVKVGPRRSDPPFRWLLCSSALPTYFHAFPFPTVPIHPQSISTR